MGRADRQDRLRASGQCVRAAAQRGRRYRPQRVSLTHGARLMLTWLRLIADRIMRRNGKPSRLDAATRMAMDAYFTPRSQSSRPPPPDAARHARGQAPMRRYTCPGFDPVEAANAVEAANSFAEQAAVS